MWVAGMEWMRRLREAFRQDQDTCSLAWNSNGVRMADTVGSSSGSSRRLTCRETRPVLVRIYREEAPHRVESLHVKGTLKNASLIRMGRRIAERERVCSLKSSIRSCCVFCPDRNFRLGRRSSIWVHRGSCDPGKGSTTSGQDTASGTSEFESEEVRQGIFRSLYRGFSLLSIGCFCLKYPLPLSRKRSRSERVWKRNRTRRWWSLSS
jgi:hypothetical protein